MVDQLDMFLKDNPDIALMVRQIEELMELHQWLVAEGKIPACELMGLDKEGLMCLNTIRKRLYIWLV